MLCTWKYALGNLDYFRVSTGTEECVNTWRESSPWQEFQRLGKRSLSAFFASICIDNTGAVRDTPMMLTLMCSRRKAGKVWLKPKQMWVAQVAEANQPIQKVGLAGAGSHSGPEGSWVTCQVSEWRAIAHCYVLCLKLSYQNHLFPYARWVFSLRFCKFNNFCPVYMISLSCLRNPNSLFF